MALQRFLETYATYKMKSSVTTRRRAHAFTLLELLVAMTVAGVLLAVVSALALQAASLWQRASAALTTRLQADLIFDRITQDLQSAVMARDGNVWLAATFQSAPQRPSGGDASMVDATWSGRVKPALEVQGEPASSLHIAGEAESFSRSRFGQAGIWLRFFTTQPDTQTDLHNLSAPRAVGYQLVRRRLTASASAASTSETPVRYLLYRSSARPASTDGSRGNSTFDVGYDLFSSGSAPAYSQGDASQIDDVGNLRTPRRYEQVIGNNVIDFGVRCWVRDERSGELAPLFPAFRPEGTQVRGFAATVRDGEGRAASVSPVWGTGPSIGVNEMAYGFPERVDVFVRILTDEGAQVIEAYEKGLIARPEEAGDDDHGWWELAERHSQIFVTSVRLTSHVL